ncbi:hypothetical protein COLO4_22707 [Corchorus olitorius]|uniref:Uncharacterized protein n=1 Tax=Corchorus olitorius TaxID=93759 RepID=A0A1R3IKF8_9ROSI|nr:hypothetical protein COLO4_22707 [Corchorus olitorius]
MDLYYGSLTRSKSESKLQVFAPVLSRKSTVKMVSIGGLIESHFRGSNSKTNIGITFSTTKHGGWQNFSPNGLATRHAPTSISSSFWPRGPIIDRHGLGETFGRVTIEAMAFGLPPEGEATARTVSLCTGMQSSTLARLLAT